MSLTNSAKIERCAQKSNETIDRYGGSVFHRIIKKNFIYFVNHSKSHYVIREKENK